MQILNFPRSLLKYRIFVCFFTHAYTRCLSLSLYLYELSPSELRYSAKISSGTSVKPRSTMESGSPMTVPASDNNTYTSLYMWQIRRKCYVWYILCTREGKDDVDAYRWTVVDAFTWEEELLPMDNNSSVPVHKTTRSIIMQVFFSLSILSILWTWISHIVRIFLIFFYRTMQE